MGEFICLLAVLDLAAAESPNNLKGGAILEKAVSFGHDRPKLEVAWLAAEKIHKKGIELRYVISVLAWWEANRPEKLINQRDNPKV